MWVWHCILILAGVNRIVTRSVQLLSHRVRYFLMKMMMHRSALAIISDCITPSFICLFRYLSKNKHVRHIQHYVATCSIGDWFVLYQMSKNMNKRFFAEFLALLSLKVTKYICLLLLLI